MRFYAVAAVTLTLDLVTKGLILQHFSLGQSLPVLPGLFNLTLVLNPGAAFGFLAELPEHIRHPFFVGIALLAAVLIILYQRRYLRGQALATCALGLVLGGAVGNLIDRLRYGMVVDFLDFYLGRYHWPAFNVADSAISVGVGLLFLDMVREWWRERRRGDREGKRKT